MYCYFNSLSLYHIHAGVDYVVLGNHEFDFDIETVSKRIQELKAKCLNSNINFIKDTKVQTTPSDVLNIDGFKIGFLGFCLKDTEDMLRYTHTHTLSLSLCIFLGIYIYIYI